MQSTPPVAELLARLAQFSQNVCNCLSAPNVNWQATIADSDWNLLEVICHLRDVEREIHQVRFQEILAEDGAFIAGKNADSWAKERGYTHENPQKALPVFQKARQETINLLTPLTPSDWNRMGNHAFFGLTTLRELLYIVVKHDEAHWEQIKELAG
jgi:hypothetical protein